MIGASGIDPAFGSGSETGSGGGLDLHRRPVLRFAPSPNGQLHLGHALSAATGYLMAAEVGGRFLVRLEDIDIARSRPEFVTSIFDDLRWLGLTWEEPVLVQSTRFAAYEAAAQRLREMGLLFPCFASRSEIAAVIANAPNPRDPDGAPLYTVSSRRRSDAEAANRFARGEPHAWRLDMRRAIATARDVLGGRPLTFTELATPGATNGAAQTCAARPEVWGDAVIMRKEMPASYTIAVVVDDAHQGVTHVTRGRDLFAATGLQRLLQVLLELPEPVYHHHHLVLDEVGAKLSKSAGARSIAALRSSGSTPADIWRMAGLRHQHALATSADETRLKSRFSILE